MELRRALLAFVAGVLFTLGTLAVVRAQVWGNVHPLGEVFAASDGSGNLRARGSPQAGPYGPIVPLISVPGRSDSTGAIAISIIGGTITPDVLQVNATLFASLPTTDGSLTYCSDCTIANPCAGSGTGAFAKRLNGVNVCN